MTYKCVCCGKEYKTEKGLNNHHCKYQDRFTLVEQHHWFKKWLIFKTVYKLKVKKDLGQEYIDFLKFTSFNELTKFFQWTEDVNIIDFNTYMTFVKDRNYPLKFWSSDKTYRWFLEDYLKKEPLTLACERSKKYLDSNGLSLDDLTQNRLYFSLLTGVISNKFLVKNCIDVRKLLDLKQINDLGKLLV